MIFFPDENRSFPFLNILAVAIAPLKRRAVPNKPPKTTPTPFNNGPQFFNPSAIETDNSAILTKKGVIAVTKGNIAVFKEFIIALKALSVFSASFACSDWAFKVAWYCLNPSIPNSFLI